MVWQADGARTGVAVVVYPSLAEEEDVGDEGAVGVVVFYSVAI